MLETLVDADNKNKLRLSTENDVSFMRQVYASTRVKELAQMDWNQQQIDDFVEMQFRAQSMHYKQHFPDTEYSVLTHDDEPVGRLLLDCSDSFLHIIDIALLCEHRNKGIGSYWLKRLTDTAEKQKKAIRIHVERFNPALNLYQRIGFNILEEGEVYHLMEFPASKN